MTQKKHKNPIIIILGVLSALFLLFLGGSLILLFLLLEACSHPYPEVKDPRPFVFTLTDNDTAYEVTQGEVTESLVTIIPETYNGLPVTSIGEHAFCNCVTIKEIIIPNSIEKIYNGAFSQCIELTSITIPNSVKQLGTNGAQNIDHLQSRRNNHPVSGRRFTAPIYIPTGVFELCTKLSSVTFEENSKLTVIGDSTFFGCESLTDITIPESVIYIGAIAFSECKKLKSISIPEKVASINYSTFSFCSDLSEVKFAADGMLNLINSNAFSRCKELTTIHLPKSVERIDSRAFFECDNLTNITVDPKNTFYQSENNCIIEISTNTLILGSKDGIITDTVRKIGDYAFNNRKISQITIPLSVIEIGKNAFSSCEFLQSIDLSSVKVIDDYAFSRCSSLESVTFGDKLTDIGAAAFYWCEALKKIAIPKNVKTIGNSAFVGCEEATISISNQVSGLTIGDSAFSGCKSAVEIEIPKGVIEIGDNAFAHCWELRNIRIPSTVSQMGRYVFTGCINLNIHVDMTSKPSGWHDDWNADDMSASGAEGTRTVVWEKNNLAAARLF